MSTAASPRPATAIAFIVAGAAVLLALVVFVAQLAIDTRWLYLLGYIAMAAALILLVRNELANGTAKTAALFGALGWAILLVANLVPALPGIVSSAGYFVITGASIVLGAVVLATGELTQRARVALVALMAVTALYMASAFFALYGPIAALLTILFGVASVITGFFLYSRR